ncbi:alpha-ketoglutarate-dependent dioxygenase AlkB [Sphingobacterium alkalisoli]|uniref:Alpha-ketoglutarate-dependent dioxygenase AlkB n=1 Tax=Sphingobacterium alkalisoli TaxID=1874115 RepID=A0A4U0H469_9SPHI|nr:alpha-ketoglutarate-dependent dioxygenase AlkB [Sphingobacterium alkalisoli]TJY66487.1 alpha-ketoglutarate-dependent dioxygenase AlkB [Sphingobacterium alkalisoli]GGH16113.1 DNA methylase [Sphingobacterium alkalisoli]
MKLFNPQDPTKNLLPYDGTVNYYGIICNLADHYYERLMHCIAWKNDEAIIFGKHIYTKRKIAWYGDRAFEYRYSGIQKIALPWTSDLLTLKELAETVSGETFNSCLLNLYHNGDEGMAWHSDAEKDLKPDGAIASITFGAQRKFSFKHKKTKEKVDIHLEHGSLLVMKESTQSHWLHRLPPTKTVLHPRINLTFRTIVN